MMTATATATGTTMMMDSGDNQMMHRHSSHSDQRVHETMFHGIDERGDSWQTANHSYERNESSRSRNGQQEQQQQEAYDHLRKTNYSTTLHDQHHHHLGHPSSSGAAHHHPMTMLPKWKFLLEMIREQYRDEPTTERQ
mmetsp:Transcript_5406/g.15861  ORF Transcript_5406/g.15861 Transcript_5406/m.15861 type:complete len:138 (+) Transcript_5406:900-1313(+)